MLLAIASGNTFLDPMEQSAVGALGRVSPELAAVARQAFYDFGERPIWSERVTYGTSQSSLVFLGVWCIDLTAQARAPGRQRSVAGEKVWPCTSLALYGLFGKHRSRRLGVFIRCIFRTAKLIQYLEAMACKI